MVKTWTICHQITVSWDWAKTYRKLLSNFSAQWVLYYANGKRDWLYCLIIIINMFASLFSGASVSNLKNMDQYFQSWMLKNIHPSPLVDQDTTLVPSYASWKPDWSCAARVAIKNRAATRVGRSNGDFCWPLQSPFWSATPRWAASQISTKSLMRSGAEGRTIGIVQIFCLILYKTQHEYWDYFWLPCNDSTFAHNLAKPSRRTYDSNMNIYHHI